MEGVTPWVSQKFGRPRQVARCMVNPDKNRLSAVKDETVVAVKKIGDFAVLEDETQAIWDVYFTNR